MKPYPHTYTASAEAASHGLVTVTTAELAPIDTAAPPEFGGPDGTWSPETLLCASVADCFILTFRALARAARFEWLQLECRVEGTLERAEQSARFTKFLTVARLYIVTGVNAARGRELLERAEQSCLIANSLRGARNLQPEIIVTAPRAEPATM